MNIFSVTTYRKAFEVLFGREKAARGSQWSLARLAKKTGIQASYLTNVTKQRAHLNADQIYVIGDAIGLKPEETEYLGLLMEYERSSQSRRKTRLKEQIEKLRRENIRVPKQIHAPESPLSETERERYYLDPHVELIHLYLSTRDAPTDRVEIARQWGLSVESVGNILAFLQNNGLVRLAGKKWHAEPVRQLLPRESPLCKPQQLLKRLRAMDMLQKLAPEEAYSFQATITMTEDTKTEIQALFIEFLKTAERLVGASASENIYHFQFDLFPWIVPGRR